MIAFTTIMDGLVTDRMSIVACLLLLGMAMLVAEAWRYFFKPPVEWTRKFVHVCSGLLVACFPWLITSTASVIAIAAVMLVVLVVSKRFGFLSSVHGVSRKSYGDLFYLGAVIVLFTISHHAPHYYFAAILTLAIADALAAVVGSTYHTVTFNVEASKKSFEGSAIFFLATFLTIHLPLLLLSDLPKGQTVAIAVQMAILVTLIEAISINGIDNFAIPVSVYFFLIKLDDKAVPFIGIQIVVQLLLIAALVAYCARYKYFSLSAGIACHLCLFASYALCEPTWLVPPIVGLLLFAAARKAAEKKHVVEASRYQLMAMIYISIAPLLIVFVHNYFLTFFPLHGRMMDEQYFYALYVGAICATASLSVVTLRTRFRKNNTIGQHVHLLLCTSIRAFLVVAPISLAVQGHFTSLIHWILVLAFVIIAPVVHVAFWYRHEQPFGYLSSQAITMSASIVISSSLMMLFA